MTVVDRVIRTGGVAGRSRPARPMDWPDRPTPAGGDQREWGRAMRLRLAMSDGAVVSFAVMLTQVLWVGTTASALHVPGLPGGYWTLTAALAVLWMVALAVSQSRSVPILGSGTDEYRRVINATFAAFGLFAICAMLLKIDVARGFLAIALPAGGFCLLVARHLWRRWLGSRRAAGRYCERALLVGPSADVDFVARRILKRPESGYRIVGVAIPGTQKSSLHLGSAYALPVLATPDDVVTTVRQLDIDVVVIAGSDQDRMGLRQLGWELAESGTVLVLASSIGDVAGPRIHWHPVEGLPLMRIELPAFGGAKYILKRIFDVSAAALALIVVLPLILAAAFAVRLDSPGQALFRQERIGLGGNAFRILKLRSMRLGAEHSVGDSPAARTGKKTKDDPRITRVGAFIREYSIDELPQLLNVLRGDMSLVGPRPHVRSEVDHYGPAMRRRLRVKPGLTGLWQVSGRSDLDPEESERLDLYYADNWSLAGDFVILLRTVRAVLRKDGAY